MLQKPKVLTVSVVLMQSYRLKSIILKIVTDIQKLFVTKVVEFLMLNNFCLNNFLTHLKIKKLCAKNGRRRLFRLFLCSRIA